MWSYLYSDFLYHFKPIYPTACCLIVTLTSIPATQYPSVNFQSSGCWPLAWIPTGKFPDRIRIHLSVQLYHLGRSWNICLNCIVHGILFFFSPCPGFGYFSSSDPVILDGCWRLVTGGPSILSVVGNDRKEYCTSSTITLWGAWTVAVNDWNCPYSIGFWVHWAVETRDGTNRVMFEIAISYLSLPIY